MKSCPRPLRRFWAFCADPVSGDYGQPPSPTQLFVLQLIANHVGLGRDKLKAEASCHQLPAALFRSYDVRSLAQSRPVPGRPTLPRLTLAV